MQQQLKQYEEGTYDEAKVQALVAQQAQTLVQLKVQETRIHNELFQLLTPDQQAKMKEFEANREARMQQRMQSCSLCLGGVRQPAPARIVNRYLKRVDLFAHGGAGLGSPPDLDRLQRGAMAWIWLRHSSFTQDGSSPSPGERFLQRSALLLSDAISFRTHSVQPPRKSVPGLRGI